MLHSPVLYCSVLYCSPLAIYLLLDFLKSQIDRFSISFYGFLIRGVLKGIFYFFFFLSTHSSITLCILMLLAWLRRKARTGYLFF